MTLVRAQNSAAAHRSSKGRRGPKRPPGSGSVPLALLSNCMNLLTFLVLIGLALWWYKPLRLLIMERTNRAFKAALILFPILYVARLGYNIYSGSGTGEDLVAAIVIGLFMLWGVLIWFGNWLERRRPTKEIPPDWSALARLPGKIPGVAQLPVNVPQVQRAAQVANDVASRVDWDGVAKTAGRRSGRFVGLVRRSVKAATNEYASSSARSGRPARRAPAPPR